MRSRVCSAVMAVAVGLISGACALTPATSETPPASVVPTPASSQVSPSSVVSTPVSSEVPPSSLVPIVLREAPSNLGCDAIGVPYRTATIRIDASAVEQVWAVTDSDARLKAYWARGFTGGTSADPVVVDPQGQIVARDGELLGIPDGAWPRLHGYFVCAGVDAIYVLLQDPA